MKAFIIFTSVIFLSICEFLYSQRLSPNSDHQTLNNFPIPAAYTTNEYFHLLKGKKVALVGNQTSLIYTTNLLDTLLSTGINVKRIFCPEHGFRGNIEAGGRVKNTNDKKTGIRIISLYGRNYKPKPSDLKDIDIVVFDLQDVGVRFYTYISTLHYVMEACAQNNKQLIVLDRPNPNGFYIDGPLLESKYKSFVGIDPVPIVYGMTIGEYALMINGERWLKDSVKCDLTVIPCNNYNHNSWYELPVRPSPNLPNMRAVYLYPSLALFEGTIVNVGRGTDFAFQVLGHPQLDSSTISYIPVKTASAPFPPHRDTLCFGIDLRNGLITDSGKLSIRYLIFAYNHLHVKSGFFNTYFYNLSGTVLLRKQIESGLSEDSIHLSWQAGLDKFKLIRKKYLLYP